MHGRDILHGSLGSPDATELNPDMVSLIGSGGHEEDDDEEAFLGEHVGL